MGTRRSSDPARHHYVGVRVRDQRIGKRHPGRTRPDDQIVSIDPRHGLDATEGHRGQASLPQGDCGPGC